MRGRQLLSALLVTGVLLAGMPVAAVARSGPRALHRSTYSGLTAQKRRIRIALAGRRIYLIRFKIELRCHDGGILYDDLSDFEATRLRAEGRFSDLQVGPSDKVRWQGRVRGRKVRGRLRVQDRLRNGVRCDSGFVGFAARRR